MIEIEKYITLDFDKVIKVKEYALTINQKVKIVKSGIVIKTTIENLNLIKIFIIDNNLCNVLFKNLGEL